MRLAECLREGLPSSEWRAAPDMINFCFPKLKLRRKVGSGGRDRTADLGVMKTNSQGTMLTTNALVNQRSANELQWEIAVRPLKGSLRS